MSSDEIPPPDPLSPKPSAESADETPGASEDFDVVNPISSNQSTTSKPSQPPPSDFSAPNLPDGFSYADIMNELLEKELSMEIVELSYGEYIMVALMYMIQNRPYEARLTIVRALDKRGQAAALSALGALTNAVADEDLTAGLKLLHNLTLHESFRPYLVELTRRLWAHRVQQIQRAYSSIKTDKFVEALGYEQSNAQIEEFLAKTEWTKTDNGKIIEPRDTVGFRQFLSTVQDPKFGAEKANKPIVNAPTQTNAALLQRYVQYAETLDRS
ncbi:hypothetical protein M3Y98_00796900 [Aphelenchoides besseyi]|nr:hypothetical protein M3Y98_00796900 [Aphelenchoides besseyi]KAI6211998.1 hypothetical protein M3Y96_00493700 [Aphelenchoides besseyi]